MHRNPLQEQKRTGTAAAAAGATAVRGQAKMAGVGITPAAAIVQRAPAGDTNRPARPSDPATQMSNLLAKARNSGTPKGKCYHAVKHAIINAGGYGDILNIYNDTRFSPQGSAVDFAASVKSNGAANLGLTEITGTPTSASAGTILVIKGNGKQRISQTDGDISVIEGVQGNSLVSYNDGKMALPGDAKTWDEGRYSGTVVGMYQPIART